MPGNQRRTEAGEESVTLQRQLNLFDCFSMVVGIIIGSGIFISPKGVLQSSNSVGWFLVIWVFSGIFSCFGALSYVELATSIPLSGGDYTYLRLSFGGLFSFLRIWTIIAAVRTGPLTLLSITAGTYLAGKSAVCSPIAVRLFAACVLCAVTFLNCWSVSLSKKVQNICTVAKMLGLLVIIVAGLAQLPKGTTSSFQHPFQRFPGSPGPVDWKNFPSAFFSGVYAFSGWQNLPQVTEEIVQPGKTMPAAICLAMGFVTVFYMLTNLAYLAVLTPAEMLASDAVAMTFGEAVLGSYWWLMPVAVTLSCFGSINGGLFCTARSFFAASREGQLPHILGMVHVHRKTPLAAAALSLPVCLMMLMIDDIYSLINYLSFSRWIFIGMTCAAVPYFRFKYPHIDRPFKVPLIIPILFALCAFFVVLSSALSDTPAFLGGLTITIIGVPIYFLGIKWKRKPRCFDIIMCRTTRFLQTVFLIVDTQTSSSSTHGRGLSRGSREPLLLEDQDQDDYHHSDSLLA
ncbi:cystine/glutamate transporter-like isoform X2 [Apostichopus japonicus]